MDNKVQENMEKRELVHANKVAQVGCGCILIFTIFGFATMVYLLAKCFV